MTNAHLELTVRINADAHPRLHAYLLTREPGKRRAAALKRLAEDALLLAGNATPPAPRVADTDRRTLDGATTGLPRVTTSEVRSSLAQFRAGEKP